LAAAQLCEGIRKDGKIIAGHELSLTVSIGGAIHVDGQPLEKTMKVADMALYHAKRSGRDRFYIADATDTMPALILRSSNG
jgi:GGDEF domain-containing protein